MLCINISEKGGNAKRRDFQKSEITIEISRPRKKSGKNTKKSEESETI